MQHADKRYRQPAWISFNPHPALGLDATTVSASTPTRSSVSILIRPSGWMQPVALAAWSALMFLFQSSSGPRAGCNFSVEVAVCSAFQFQSSSGPRAGCNQKAGEIKQQWSKVSILIRPSGWMQRDCIGVCLHRLPVFQSSSGPRAGCNRARSRRRRSTSRVSILIRPSGWMQPPLVLECHLRMTKFQSSSGPRAGCNAIPCTPSRPPRRRFNPHPALGLDATRTDGCSHNGRSLFQSSSGPRAGCNAVAGQPGDVGQVVSNPHPALGLDATLPGSKCRCRGSVGFNPHPALGLDATHRTCCWKSWRCGFQSSSGPRAGCNGGSGGNGRTRCPVSILIRPSGWMQPRWG